MKKICHITSAHQSNDTRIFYKECSSLSKNGYDVTLVSTGNSREENKVKIVGIGDYPKSRLKRILFTTKKVFEKALDLDCYIYHIHDPELIPFGIKLKKYGKKVIFDCHEDIFGYIQSKEWIPTFFRKPLSILLNHYFKTALKKFDALISVTPHLHNKLLKINDNTIMVTNFPILTDLDVKEKNGKDFKIIYTGGITKQWSHIEIIKAIQDIDDIKYEAYGKYDDGNYKSYCNSLDISGNYIYKGFAKHEDIPKILSNADIGMALLKPSNNTDGRNGTLGNTKIFEYMMAGIPVICSKLKLWEEMVDKHHCGICVYESDPVKIRDAILKLKNNPKLSREMGQNGRKAVENEYCWKTQEENLINLYKSLE